MPNSLNPSAIWHYDQVTGDAGLGVESTRNLESITPHVERHVGPVTKIIHETASQFVHVDILHVLPSAQRDFHVLVTSGMRSGHECSRRLRGLPLRRMATTILFLRGIPDGVIRKLTGHLGRELERDEHFSPLIKKTVVDRERAEKRR